MLQNVFKTLELENASFVWMEYRHRPRPFGPTKRCIEWKLATIYVQESISTSYFKHLLTILCALDECYARRTTINKQQVICHSLVRRWVNFVCCCYECKAVICDHWVHRMPLSLSLSQLAACLYSTLKSFAFSAFNHTGNPWMNLISNA